MNITKKEEFALRMQWNRKLKESGFQDIEKWDSFKVKNKQKIQFIRSHIRWSDFGTKEKFLRVGDDTSSYFRVLGLYAHHGPIKDKYRELFLLYCDNGNLKKSIRDLKLDVTVQAVHMYITRNMPKMVKYVNDLDNESDYND